MVEAVGYSRTTARAWPGRTIEQKGTQEALAERGFTEANFKGVVTRCIEANDSTWADKLKAGDMGFKVLGSYAAEKVINLNMEHTPESSDGDLLMEYESKLKERLTASPEVIHSPTIDAA